jgi:tRNA nucleotidyltransferase (CCA-adding enzyme)
VSLANWQRDILARGELFRIGGYVRDRLVDPAASPADTDFLVRGIPPDELERILRTHGRLALVGKRFGVYIFTPSNGDPPVDIVYPRRERSTGPGHREFDVQWDWQLPLEDDLARRDFTINAIAEDVRGGDLIDPLGGRRDLEKRILRAIFSRAFEEDPLRILRGFRFAAQLGLSVDPVTEDRMRESVDLLATLSVERVQEELTKILSRCRFPSRAFSMAHDLGALQILLPELERGAGVEQNEYHPDDVFVHSIKTCDAAPAENFAVRWAALLHDIGKVDARTTVVDERGQRVVFYGHEHVGARMAAEVLERLRYPKALVTKCHRLIEHHMFNYVPQWTGAAVRRFMRAVGENNLDDIFSLREADCRSRNLTVELENLDALRARVAQEIDASHTLSVKSLAVDGGDVMQACGMEAGPEVGRILQELLELVIEEPGLNVRGRLLECARRLTGSRREGK